MKPIHLRFNHTLISQFSALREGRERFRRLLPDQPTGIRIANRVTSPGMDIKRGYRRALVISSALSIAIHALWAIAFPTFDIRAALAKQDQLVIHMEDIPETRQIVRPPPPPRPAMPIETESDDVPEDVTIESTDLDFDDPLDLLPPPTLAAAELEEEILEVYAVENQPTYKKTVRPEYPEAARSGSGGNSLSADGDRGGWKAA